MNPSMAHGGLGPAGGIDPNFLHKANSRIDELTGIRDVEARILEIERLLDHVALATERLAAGFWL